MAADDGRRGPTASELRKRALAASNGLPVQADPSLPPGTLELRDGGKVVATVVHADIVRVPVQQAQPGRRCQVCSPGPEVRLACWTRPSLNGGRDYFCEWHKDGSCVNYIEVREAPSG